MYLCVCSIYRVCKRVKRLWEAVRVYSKLDNENVGGNEPTKETESTRATLSVAGYPTKQRFDAATRNITNLLFRFVMHEIQYTVHMRVMEAVAKWNRPRRINLQVDLSVSRSFMIKLLIFVCCNVCRFYFYTRSRKMCEKFTDESHFRKNAIKIYLRTFSPMDSNWGRRFSKISSVKISFVSFFSFHARMNCFSVCTSLTMM